MYVPYMNVNLTSWVYNPIIVVISNHTNYTLKSRLLLLLHFYDR